MAFAGSLAAAMAFAGSPAAVVAPSHRGLEPSPRQTSRSPGAMIVSGGGTSNRVASAVRMPIGSAPSTDPETLANDRPAASGSSLKANWT
jgi:hypothetical protein